MRESIKTEQREREVRDVLMEVMLGFHGSHRSPFRKRIDVPGKRLRKVSDYERSLKMYT